MGKQALDVAPTKERLAPAARNSSAQFKKIGLTVAAKEADLKKLEEALKKVQVKMPKASVQFVLSFDGKTIDYYVEVGGARMATLATLALASAGRPGVQRAILQKLIANSVAADAGDLAKFNKDHPPPPTPDEQGKLARAIGPLRMTLRDTLAAARKAADDLKTVQAQIKPLEDLEKEYKKRVDAD